jgi:two-component system sensor histidine kinase YesM
MSRERGIWHSIRNYRFNSIFIRNFLLIVLLITLPVVGISKLVYDNSNRIVENEIININDSSLYRITVQLNEIFNGLNRLATLLSQQSKIQMFMLENNIEGPAAGDLTDLNDTIRMFNYTQHYIASIYIYSETNRFVISNRINSPRESFGDTGWYEPYSAAKDNTIIIRHGKRWGVYPYLLTFIKPVYIDKYKKIGAIVVNVDIEEIGKLIQDPDEQEYHNIFIINRDNVVIYSKNRDMLFQDAGKVSVLKNIISSGNKKKIMGIDGEKFAIAAAKSEYEHWLYVSYLPLRVFDTKFSEMIGNIAKWIMLFAVVGLLISLAITERTYNPIKRILNVVENPDETLDALTEKAGGKSGTNELKFIAGSIMKTTENSRQMKTELERRLKLLNEAQSAALQAQINPHFMYNTLETIKWMSMELTGAKNDVSAAIGTLSNLFRISLNTSERMVPLAVELEHTKLYLKIIELRYAGKITVSWDIPEELLQCRVLKIFMQPLIENAFDHGIKPKRAQGHIHIGARQDGDSLCVEIRDDGIGMDSGIAEQLNQAMKENSIGSAEHIGLRNVNQRIQLLFGQEYGISVVSAAGEGTAVTASFPMVE